MAQFARPVSDISTGLWSATPLWPKIDEGAPGSSDTIQSDDNTSPDDAIVGLSSVSDPGVSTGHVLRVRWRKSAGGTGHVVDASILLWQAGGSVPLASGTVSNIGSTLQTDTFTLSGAQADSITDYSALQIQLRRAGDTGGSPNGRRSLVVDFAELEVPDATNQANLAGTLPALTGGFDAGVAVKGDLAGSLPGLTAAFDAGVQAAGDLAATLPSLTASFSAGASNARTADFAAALPAFTASLDAGVRVSGGISASLPALSGAFGAKATATGGMSVSLPLFAAELDAGVTIKGSLDASLPGLTASMDMREVAKGPKNAVRRGRPRFFRCIGKGD